MKVLLLQVDGSQPNIALMRLAAHHCDQGDTVTLRRCPTVTAAERGLWDSWDRVYASAIFERSQPVCRRLLETFPGIQIGGSGWDEAATLEGIGVVGTRLDYSLYPDYRPSIGFTQRGCTFRCSFCKVPRMEGRIREEQTIGQLWRGEPWPRHLLLLDNDFFGSKLWREKIKDMISGEFKVCFNQGINVRTLTDERAAALAMVDYRDDSFSRKRLYTAWDNRDDEDRLFRGLSLLTFHGVKPDGIMVYMLIGYDHDVKAGRPCLTEDDFHRHKRLREFGCRPYPMPFLRTPETRGFQRWIVGAYDKRVSWERFVAAKYQPENLQS